VNDSLRLWVPLAAASLLMAGCPGTLDDPDRFLDAGPAIGVGGDGGGGGGNGTGGAPCGNVEQEIFLKTCATSLCHHDGSSGKEIAGGLDLTPPGVAARLVGKQPNCVECLATALPECEGSLLIDPADPSASYLLQKLLRKTPLCGDQMPPPLGPTQEMIACVEQWVRDVANTGPGGSAGAGGGAGTTAAGGAAGAAGGT
jgi:hypothetical protein